MPKWWYEYRYQRTKGCTVRTSLWRAFHYQPPPTIDDLSSRRGGGAE